MRISGGDTGAVQSGKLRLSFPKMPRTRTKQWPIVTNRHIFGIDSKSVGIPASGDTMQSPLLPPIIVEQ